MKAISKNENVLPYALEDNPRECFIVLYMCLHSIQENVHLSNVAEQLVEKGLASVVRHRRDDEDRSPDYDKLMAAEQT